jgi:hypothetical protein
LRGRLTSAVAHRYRVFIVKVFLSWSGERSKAVAEALKSWLPQVIQSLEPWISSEIDKGRKWSTELATELETVPVGIICLTRDNLTKPWILFEAGALSKNANTWTFLFDVTGANVEQPLAQFQHTENEKEDIRKLVRSIAAAAKNAGEKVPDGVVLDEIFETFWPKLEARFKAVAPVKAGAAAAGAVRSDREILEEILEVVRREQRRDDRVVPTHSTFESQIRAATVLLGIDSSEEHIIRFHAELADNPFIDVRRLGTGGRTAVRFVHPVPLNIAEEVIHAAAEAVGVRVVSIRWTP